MKRLPALIILVAPPHRWSVLQALGMVFIVVDFIVGALCLGYLVFSLLRAVW